MRKPAYEKALGAELGPSLGTLDFSQIAPLWFSRSTGPAKQSLRFSCRLDAARCLVAGTAGISFRQLEEILRPASDGQTPTIVVPLHLLHEDRRYFEWELKSVDDAPKVASAVLEEVGDHAEPFFVEFSEIDGLRSRLQSPRPRDWFALTPEQRDCLLASIAAAGGDREGAVEILERALAERAAAHPKKRRMIEDLLARLLSGNDAAAAVDGC